MAVDTKHVSSRRKLHFASIQDALRDAQLLADAEGKGTLKPLGNWTLGQTFGHLAGWINDAFDGFPPDLNPPWFIRLILKPMKSKYLKGMPAGVRIPRQKDGTKHVEVIPTAQGLARLNAAWQRLGNAAPTHPSPVFGPMTHEEWLALNLRHAELHQGFFLPQ